MANTNYLDELDGLLDNPEDADESNDLPAPSRPKKQPPIAATADEITHDATMTWAAVIENASNSLQEGARTVQDAAHKNLELAKNQHENIKELVDAANGWRHATRHAVQEVSSAKKNVIMLTILSAAIALAGFGTTIGVMLQSRAGMSSMGNAVLENVDEHQTLVSKTLTLKMDEMAATIERMEAVINQMPPEESFKKQAQREQIVPEGNTESETETEVTAPTKTQRVIANTTAETTNPTVLNKELADKLENLTGKLTELEQNWKQSDGTLQKQIALIPNAVDDKLSPKLQKISNNPVATGSAPVTAATVVTQDNKAVLEQLTRIRQDISEVRQLQTNLKEQVNQIKQGSKEGITYQYRIPEVERYPH